MKYIMTGFKLKHVFLSISYLLFVFFCIMIADKMYSKYEKFPFESTTIILQMWRPEYFKVSDIAGLIYEMVPNLKSRDIETNSMGIRDKEYKIPKPLNTFRVLILGDSVAYGLELDRKEIFSTLLEEKLNNNQNEIQYEIINASVPGYNTMQEYIAFVNKYYIYKPDLLLVCFCHNDISPAFIQGVDGRGNMYSYLRPKFINSVESGFIAENITPYEMLSISMPNIFRLPDFIHRRLMSISSLYRGITIRIYDSLSRKNQYKYPFQAYLNIVKDQTEYAIKQLKAYCQANNIDLIFVLFSHLTDKYPIPEEKIYDFISEGKRILEYNSIRHVDLRFYYKSRIDTFKKVRLAPGDTTHLNALGHKLSADALYDYLIDFFKNNKIL